jgi:hypothetical protein
MTQRKISDRDLWEFLSETADYYRRPLSMPLFATYRDSLSRWSLEELKTARKTHYEDSERGQYFPLIADFVRLLADKSVASTRKYESPVHIETPLAKLRHAENMLDQFSRPGSYNEELVTHWKAQVAELKLQLGPRGV